MYSVKGVPVHLRFWQNKKIPQIADRSHLLLPISYQMSLEKTSCNKILTRQLSRVYEMAQTLTRFYFSTRSLVFRQQWKINAQDSASGQTWKASICLGNAVLSDK